MKYLNSVSLFILSDFDDLSSIIDLSLCFLDAISGKIASVEKEMPNLFKRNIRGCLEVTWLELSRQRGSE